MANSQCDLTNPNFAYPFCPSYGAAVLFAVLFSITTAYHVYQSIQHRKPFAAILIMGGTWEVLGYIIRTASIHNPTSTGLYTAQMLLILLAPLWINAFVYMLVGRMVHFFLDDDRIFGIKARKMALIFVVFDVVAFVVQGTGGSMSSSTDMSTALNGLHVYTAGVALQILFNAFFLAVVGVFHKIARSSLPTSDSTDPENSPSPRTNVAASSIQPLSHRFRDCFILLCLTYVVTGLILFRNFYRLAEFASGLNNTILKHEWYAYIFDALPMFAAFVLINVFHPGRKLQGPRCDFSEENRAMKQAKRDRKLLKQAEGTEKKSINMTGKLPSVSYELLGANQV